MVHCHEKPMTDEVALLFRELADLSAPEREDYFRQRNIRAELRAEVESLLEFDSGEATERRYTRAKVIDMIFFVAGGP